MVDVGKRSIDDVEDLCDQGDVCLVVQPPIKKQQTLDGKTLFGKQFINGLEVLFRPVVSLSRRTDVMVFWDKYLAALRAGGIVWMNPIFRNKTRWVELRPSHGVVCLAFWSKDYAPLIDTLFTEGPDRDLLLSYPGMTFNFTLNSPVRELEPGIRSSYADRIAQMEKLCSLYGPEAVIWRFDPICYYERIPGKFVTPSAIAEHVDDKELTPRPLTLELFGPHARDNLSHFASTCSRVSQMGIRRVVVAFMRPEAKALRAFAAAGMKAIMPNPAQRKTIIRDMIDMSRPFGVVIYACSSADLVGVHASDAEYAVKESSCISIDDIRSAVKKHSNVAARIPDEDIRKDAGQRKVCHCMRSVDIGSYDDVCRHGCRYCYATPCTYH